MMCFRDRTYCNDYQFCAHKDECPRPLTPEVQKAADEWWGKPGAPICFFAGTPKCQKRMITVWARINRDGTQSHNHIEDGWVKGIHPIGKTKDQKKAWKGIEWICEHAYLVEGKVIR